MINKNNKDFFFFNFLMCYTGPHKKTWQAASGTQALVLPPDLHVQRDKKHMGVYLGNFPFKAVNICFDFPFIEHQKTLKTNETG